MPNVLISNKSLESFAKKVNLPEEEKKNIIEKIPNMSEDVRWRLYETLKDIYLLDLEEKEALKKLGFDKD